MSNITLLNFYFTITIIRAHPLFDQDILAVALPLFENEMLTGALYLSIPLAEIYEPFSEIQGYLITGGIISLLIITLIIAKTVQNITHPLNKMKAPPAARIWSVKFNSVVVPDSTPIRAPFKSSKVVIPELAGTIIP